MAWTDEKKQEVIKEYVDEAPTPETSMKIVTQLAEAFGESPNSVRAVLSKAGVYVKKEAAAASAGPKKESASGSVRVSKEGSIAALRATLQGLDAPVDDEILSKMTGKAAVYFVEVLKTISSK